MEVLFRIEGDRQLMQDLAQLERRVAGKIARRAVRIGGNIVKDEAENRALFTVGGEMGALLAENMQVAPFKKQRRGAYGVTVQIRPNIAFVHVTQTGERQYIPHAIEFGHQSLIGEMVMPIPFLRPAVESQRERAADRVAAEIASGIKLHG